MDVTRTGPPPSAGSDRRVVPLAALAAISDRIEGVRRGELREGERLLVATRNSIYCLTALADGRFLVAGGCFARRAAGEATGGGHRVAVAGCTAGGHALFTGIVAAPGLFLEFADGTRTTRIRHVRRLGEADEATLSDS